METNRKVILYIAMTVDGYIAAPGDDLSFLSVVEKEGQDYGYGEFIKTVDTVVLGRKTYDKVLSFGIPFPHADKQTYVITRTKKPQEGNIRFYSGNLKDLITELKQQVGKTIFIDGGAEVVNELLQFNLIEEFVISVIPVLLGNGVPLFKYGRPFTELRLINSRAYDTGLVQVHYRRKN